MGPKPGFTGFWQKTPKFRSFLSKYRVLRDICANLARARDLHKSQGFFKKTLRFANRAKHDSAVARARQQKFSKIYDFRRISGIAKRFLKSLRDLAPSALKIVYNFVREPPAAAPSQSPQSGD